MIQKLADKIKKTNAPICVGLDPMLDYIPEELGDFRGGCGGCVAVQQGHCGCRL